MSAQQIRQRLEMILNYLQPHWEFVNCHMVNYITDKHWEQYIPASLRDEVTSVEEVNNCIQTIFWQTQATDEGSNNYPAFSEFLRTSKEYRLEKFTEIITTMKELQVELGKADGKSEISIKEFMSEKKRHEVEITAELINDLMTKYMETTGRETFIVDAGDGKGYLSSRLAIQYGHKVLGIDSNIANTENALERSQRLQRAWNGLTERAELQSMGITPPRRGAKKQKSYKHNAASSIASNCQQQQSVKLNNYKTTAKFITNDVNVTQLLREFFPNAQHPMDQAPAFCLTGLHTCGNLAATCIQLFQTEINCKVLCNIGCCYHLLKEKYIEREFFGNKEIMAMNEKPGFPLSRFLQEKHVRIGRNARMLAAQSIERTLAAKELPNVSLFYRALLEVLILSENNSDQDAIKVGKIQKFQNFSEYVQLCCKKAQLNFESIPCESIAQMEFEYANDKAYLDLFYLLRMTFAPILESLILLDRLLYLKELGYEHTHLISVFDAVVSPRHFALIAIKS